jgi:hypothetical protein
MSMNIHHSRFAIHESPYCVWGYDLPRQNLEFLDSIDPNFFPRMAEVHGTVLQGEEGHQHAALALRLFYSHALETLLSLLAATIQAPDCVVGWLCQYKEQHLQSVLNAIQSGRPVLTKLALQEFTWEKLSEIVHNFVSIEDKERERRIKEGYAIFWSRAAHSYLNERNRLEYNSIKHGLRARAGGYTLRMREEKEPGVPDPEAPIHVLAASDFGTSFFIPERIGQNKLHLGLKHQSVNWRPQALLDGLILVGMSLSNIIGFLKCCNGVEPDTVQFRWPRELSVFDSAWEGAPGAQACSFGSGLRPEHIKPISASDILKVYVETDDYHEASNTGLKRTPDGAV